MFLFAVTLGRLLLHSVVVAHQAEPATAAAAPQSGSADLASLLQQPQLPKLPTPSQPEPAAGEPFVISLRRESVPIYRRGKVASFKTSYSGVLNVGSPPQEFRVVFDTGSGHIVLPAAECKSEACLVEGRRRFNMTASSTAVAVNTDGSIVPEGEHCDQVTIGFGTGEITGEFARDTVCFGGPLATSRALAQVEHDAAAPEASAQVVSDAPEEHGAVVSAAAASGTELCVEMSVILAVEMSTQPFKTFRFDGILGLGLDGLALNKHFSAFEMLLGTGLPESHFGVFLTEGEDGEESEIAMGGHDPRRILHPLSWAPVAMADLGYWQVEIVAVRINGIELDVCKDGTCRGVVDTGTSHLGIPAPYDGEVARLLTRDSGDLLDCRLSDAPEIEIELQGYNLTLHPFNYMRRLPLREGVSVSSVQGVYVPSAETNATFGGPSSADPVGERTADGTAVAVSEAAAAPEAGAAPAAGAALQQAASDASQATEAPHATAADVGEAAVLLQAAGANAAEATEARVAPQATKANATEADLVPRVAVANATEANATEVNATEANATEVAVKRFCRPRLMPVRLPEPLGPKLFILGEPVLHRYYTVYDWANHRVGFSLANNRRNTMDPSEIVDRRGTLPKEVDVLLMQNRMRVLREAPSSVQRLAGGHAAGAPAEMQEESVLVQVRLKLSLRPRRPLYASGPGRKAYP